MSDFIEDPDAINPQAAVIQSGLTEHTRELLMTLTAREAHVLRMRFGIGEEARCTLDEVGRGLGVTRERVRQIKEKALLRLRHASRARFLETFVT